MPREQTLVVTSTRSFASLNLRNTKSVNFLRIPALQTFSNDAKCTSILKFNFTMARLRNLKTESESESRCFGDKENLILV